MNADGHRFFGLKMTLPSVMGVWLIAAGLAFAGYYDFKTFDHQKAYEYLDEVEAAVGTEEFEAVPYEQAFAMALPLGRIDKWYLTPQTFMGHVKRTQVARKRFYRECPLTDDEVTSDLLAFRIRYESTANADWMEQVAMRFEPVTAKSTTADEAAASVFEWMTEHLEIMDSCTAYKLPSRGDLDPLTVLKGGRGSEVDLAICGVAALRASGVVARIVWAPALRGENGGKVWLEYLGEDRGWHPWVPSFDCGVRGDGTDCSVELGQDVPATHLAEIRKRFGDKIVLVMTRPEAPREITDQYVATANLEFKTDDQAVEISLMVFGRQGLMVARGNEVEEMKNERSVKVGKGLVIAAASFGGRSFALLPIEISSEMKNLVVRAGNGGLRVEDSPPTVTSSKMKTP